MTTLTMFNFWSSIKSFNTISQDDAFQYNEIVPITTSIPKKISETDIPYLTMYGTHRAERSFALLPEWLQTYFEWHREQTQNRSEDTKYVVLTCLRRCGGASDRLRPLPFFLLYASLVPRVVCIHWPIPFGLENYLAPPVDNAGRMVDWRCPLDVSEAFAQDISNSSFNKSCPYSNRLSCYEGTIKNMRKNNNKYVFLDLRNYAIDRINKANEIFQLHSYADKMPPVCQWQFVDLMGDIFRVMFEPVPALAESINSTMTILGLKENEYVSVHVRARYPYNQNFKKYDLGGGLKLEGREKSYLFDIVNNAVSCGSLLAMNSTIYFASDSHEVVKDAITRDISLDGGIQVQPVGIHRDKEPLHSNVKHPGSHINDFFPLFEDLLIMGGSKCVAHGLGSFGSFGAGLIGNQCRTIHRRWNGDRIFCPNNRTECDCVNTVQRYDGKMLFGSVRDGKRRVSSPLCDHLNLIKDINTSSPRYV